MTVGSCFLEVAIFGIRIFTESGFDVFVYFTANAGGQLAKSFWISPWIQSLGAGRGHQIHH
jgi:hypothetical protein